MGKVRMIMLLELILSINAIGQNKITGKITNTSGVAVKYATVRLMRNEKNIQAAFSDSTGKYILNNIPFGKYHLICSYLGITQVTMDFSIHKDTLINVMLTSDEIKKLQAVTINGKRPLIEHKVDRTILNVENSVLLIGGNAMDALKKAPGVVITSDNNISLIGRGGVKVMINDRMIKLSGKDLSNFLSAIPTSQIAKIEVITTPPSKYDAEGASGLINIITKKSKISGVSGSIEGVYTQSVLPSQVFNSSIYWVKKKFTLIASLGLGYNRKNSNKKKDIYFPTQQWKNTSKIINYNKYINGSLSGEYRFTKNDILSASVTGNYQHNRLKKNTVATIFSNKSIIDSIIDTKSIDTNYSNTTDINLYYEHKFGTKSQKKISIAGDYLDFNTNEMEFLNNNTYDSLHLNVISSSKFKNISPRKTKVYTGQVDVSLPYKWASLSFGSKLSFIRSNSANSYYNTDFSNPILDSSKSDQFQYEENTAALYFSAQKKLGDIEIKLGLRGENTSTNGISKTYNEKEKNSYFKVFPTFYLLYSINHQNSINFNYSKRISRPDYYRLNPFRLYSNPYLYSEGNPFLEPSFTNNIDIVYSYNNWLTSAFYFQKETNGFDGIALPDPVTKITAVEQMNFLTSTSYTLFESIYFNKLNWLESYNQIAVQYNNNKSTIPNTRKGAKGFTAYFSTDNTIYWNKSKTFMSNFSFWYQAPQSSGIDKVHSYYSLDFGIKALILNKRLTIGLAAYDILKTFDVRFESLTNDIRQVYDSYYGSRKVRLTVSYIFGNESQKRTSKSSNAEERKRLE